MSVRSLTSSRLMLCKAVLFLLVGVSASSLVLLEYPTVKVAALLVISAWGFCRFYYFVFYVIEHHIDPNYRFSGLVSAAHYFATKKRHQH